MGLRGVRVVFAMILVSELGDIHRFAHPRQLMAYLGLVPSESSSGGKRPVGGLTKTGNAHAWWLINESARHYRLPPKVSASLSKRQEGIGKEHRAEVRRISWKCQQRLYDKGRRLAGRLKMRQKVQIALARELCGFVWAVMKAVQPSPPLEVMNAINAINAPLGASPQTPGVYRFGPGLSSPPKRSPARHRSPARDRLARINLRAQAPLRLLSS